MEPRPRIIPPTSIIPTFSIALTLFDRTLYLHRDGSWRPSAFYSPSLAPTLAEMLLQGHYRTAIEARAHLYTHTGIMKDDPLTGPDPKDARAVPRMISNALAAKHADDVQPYNIQPHPSAVFHIMADAMLSQSGIIATDQPRRTELATRRALASQPQPCQAEIDTARRTLAASNSSFKWPADHL